MRACAAIRRLAPESPVHIVLIGDALELGPALATSQRAVRQPVTSYTLVDPIGSVPEDPGWPDAPVTVISSGPAERVWQLRGWQTLSLSSGDSGDSGDHGIESLSDALARIVDSASPESR